MNLSILRIFLAFLGAIVSVGGAFLVGLSQALLPRPALFPLSIFVFVEWASLGGVCFWGLAVRKEPVQFPRINAAWFAMGALTPMAVIGVFTIGLFVFYSQLLFLDAAILNLIQNKISLLSTIKYFGFGRVINLGILLILIRISRL